MKEPVADFCMHFVPTEYTSMEFYCKHCNTYFSSLNLCRGREKNCEKEFIVVFSTNEFFPSNQFSWTPWPRILINLE